VKLGWGGGGNHFTLRCIGATDKSLTKKKRRSYAGVLPNEIHPQELQWLHKILVIR